MQITIEMIETKEFKTKPRGYDPQEVDEFLDAICDEMVRQLDQIAALQQQLAAAKAARPVVEAPTQQMKPIVAAPVKAVPDADFREILEMAQKVKNETIAAAEAKAEEIVAKAKEEAAAKLDNLDVEKETLTNQVAALKAAAAEYRTKFESLLQAQQEALEKASDLF
ncbi:MAG: DivIVA domain-containing protein [Clostridia bacterium]|nr:DivIVA domain-containing protein [Clostridia bacterium]